MIPISDNFPARRTPIVTRLIVLLNVAVFFQELGMGDLALYRFFSEYGVIPLRYTHTGLGDIFSQPAEYFPFVSSLFLHGGWLHLLGNMITLWIFGDNVEDRMGRWQFLIFYLCMGIAANIAQLMSMPLAREPIIGASGAIAGVMGAYFLLYPHARVVLAVPIFFFIDFWEVPAPVFFFFWFVIQFFSGALGLIHGEAFGNVAWWAHIGGFVCGMVIGLLFRLFFPKPPEVEIIWEDYGPRR